MDTESQKQLEKQETLEAIKKLNLLDDNLMTLVFDRNIEAAELLLNVILQRNDLKVLEVIAQREYKNPMSGGRSITIDIYAKDGMIKSMSRCSALRLEQMSTERDSIAA